MDYDFDYETLDGGFTLLSVGISLPLRKVRFTIRVDHYNRAEFEVRFLNS